MTVELQGRAQWSGQALQWQSSGQVQGDEAEFDGQWQGPALASGGVNHLSIKARLGRVDLSPWWPAGLAPRSGWQAATEALLERDASHERWPLSAEPDRLSQRPLGIASALRPFEGELDLQVAALSLPGLALERLRVQAQLQGGVARSTALSALAFGGRLEARALLDTRTQRLALQLRGRRIKLQPALQAISAWDGVSGQGSVDAELETYGHALPDLRQHLRGRVQLQLEHGAVKGIDLLQSLRRAKDQLSLLHDHIEPFQAQRETAFQTLSATWTLRGGQARLGDVLLSALALQARGEGVADWTRGRLDVRLHTELRPSALGLRGREPALVVPVLLSGTPGQLSWRWPWASLTTDRAGDDAPQAAQALRESLQRGLDAAGR